MVNYINYFPLHFSALDIGKLFILCFFAVWGIGLSDSLYSIRRRGGKTWRNYWISRIIKKNSSKPVSIIDKHLFAGPPGLALNALLYLDSKLVPESNFLKNLNITLFMYMARPHVLFVIYLFFDAYIDTKETPPPQAISLLVAMLVFYYLRCACLDFIKYYNITAISANLIYTVSKDFLLKDIQRMIVVDDIEAVNISRSWVFFPEKAYSIDIFMKCGTNHRIKYIHTIEKLNLNHLEQRR